LIKNTNTTANISCCWFIYWNIHRNRTLLLSSIMMSEKMNDWRTCSIICVYYCYWLIVRRIYFLNRSFNCNSILTYLIYDWNSINRNTLNWNSLLNKSRWFILKNILSLLTLNSIVKSHRYFFLNRSWRILYYSWKMILNNMIWLNCIYFM
jgi:hypothetical protein